MTVEQMSGRLLGEDPELEQGRLLSATGLKIAGKYFAFPSRGDLIVKLSSERVRELIDRGEGRPFTSGGGRVMKEWVALRPAGAEACAAYIVEARNFVAPPEKRAPTPAPNTSSRR